MTSFAELTKQVHLINDLILADMTCEDFSNSKDALTFSKHLLATKYWFARISYANKKRYLLALLHDLRSAWALSLLLKSMWNCRPKDAVLSVSERHVYTSYDQVPMDHNRTAIPGHTLAQVMKNDRIWFHTLEPEPQALVLSELTTVAGGPGMWEVLPVAQRLYERNRDLMLKNILECVVVDHPKTDHPQSRDGGAAGDAKQTSAPPPSPSRAKAALDAHLAVWDGTIKLMRDSLKLEELEMTFKDGSKRKIWKVNRPKPENIETVDLVQLLPSYIGKKILSYLPRAQLGDYAKVNKYWAYLVDELRAELTARTKINADIEKLHKVSFGEVELQKTITDGYRNSSIVFHGLRFDYFNMELLLRHDTSQEFFDPLERETPPTTTMGMMTTTTPVSVVRFPTPSLRPSEKSMAAYSHRQFISEKLIKPTILQKPIRNLTDLSERLERRGAADENIWKWCNCLLAHAKKHKQFRRKPEDGGSGGVLSLGNVHFPCPLMKVTMQIPVDPPMYKDPIMTTSLKPRKIMSDYNLEQAPKERVKRYSLWTRDLTNLYSVLKIPSYLHPENMVAGALAEKQAQI